MPRKRWRTSTTQKLKGERFAWSTARVLEEEMEAEETRVGASFLGIILIHFTRYDDNLIS